MKTMCFLLTVALGLLAISLAASVGTQMQSSQQYNEVPWKLKIGQSIVQGTASQDGVPRCGVTDTNNFGFFPGMPTFEKTDLTYRVTQYTPDLPNNTVDKILKRAFEHWSNVTVLTFTKIDTISDIEIIFAARDHGDGFPFDGQNGVLAHAFAPGPNIGGDIHFDEAEPWVTGSNGINLEIVGTHEIGHSLGLDHSNDSTAVMFPTYMFQDPFQLSRDDIAGIQILYGANVVTTETTTQTPDTPTTQTPDTPTTQTPDTPTTQTPDTPTTQTPDTPTTQTPDTPTTQTPDTPTTQTPDTPTTQTPDTPTTQTPDTPTTQTPDTPTTQTPDTPTTQTLEETTTEQPQMCDPDLFADAATVIKGRILLFKNGTVRILRRGIFSVDKFWPQIKSNIDAAVTVRLHRRFRRWRRRTFLFTGSQYWSSRWHLKFPRNITDFGFSPNVSKIDAALSLRRRILFFVEDHLWSFNLRTRQMTSSSPRLIRDVFKGISNVDAAFRRKWRRYLISGSSVFMFRGRRLIKQFEPQPWLNCE
ncbi:stromelysin-1-like [Chiloscyllium punctatum]|uniref:stromelysin-1-like n=1 Tax=Chiloscyllium punctatum TaxID=137246 RepID=UPI003B6392AD